MKLKYYLRGIGIGIIVTFLILYFTRESGSPLTDDQIKQRAKELGMIENVTLSEASGNNKSNGTSSSNKVEVYGPSENGVSNNVVPKNDDKAVSVNGISDNKVSDNRVSDNKVLDNDAEDNTSAANDNKKENDADNKSETNKTDTNDNKTSETKNNDSDNKPESDATEDKPASEVKQITIIAGDSSYSAAKKLQKAGIVESAAEFDEYLCRNGYDKYLIVGTHNVPVDATDEEIAKIITKKK